MKKFLLKMIAIVDSEFGIAKNGKIPWSFEEDLKFFREKTLHNIVIMGKVTFFSIQNAPLPDRINYIISKSLKSSIPNTKIFPSLEAALENIENFSNKKIPEVWLIGGASLYNYALEKNLIDEAFITQVHQNFFADQFINSKFLKNMNHEIIFSEKKYRIIRFSKKL